MRNKSVFLFFVLVLFVVGGAFLVTQKNPDGKEISTYPQTSQEQEVRVDEPADSTVLSERYISYSQAALAQATADDGRAVIFFSASWCPTCKAFKADLQRNINRIPSDVTILEADYDTEGELKTKYGVVMQDTFVQVDDQGNQIAKWNSGGRFETLLANVQ